MSALGQKRTWQQVRVMSALPPKADIGTGTCITFDGATPAAWRYSPRSGATHNKARSHLCCRGEWRERRDQDLELSRLKAITKISRDRHVVVFRNSEADAGNFIVTRFG